MKGATTVQNTVKKFTRALALTAAALLGAGALVTIPVTAATAAPPPINCSDDALIEKTFDNETSWQMCWRVDSKKGLVLEQVAVKAPGETNYRRVLDSLYLSQLHVPYDTGKNVWNDITSYGFGNQYLQKLSPAECGDGELRDVAQNWTTTRQGATTTWMRTIPGLCITDTTSPLAYRSHEQTWGSIADAPLFTADKQGFSLQIISKVDWYEYATKIEFTDEGGISFDLGATGDVSYEDFDADATTGWPIGQGTEAEFAASHWHNAIWRLDFGLDGQSNQIVEQYDSELGEMGTKTRLMHTSSQQIEAPSSLVPADDLTWWRVAAPDSRNADGHVRSYEFVFPGAQLYQGDPVTQPLLSFTNYNACQEYATNNLNTACAEKNIVDYVTSGASSDLVDPVAWVNSGFHHVVRDEDQSPMQTHWQSFTIIPRDWTSTSMGTPGGRSCINGDPGGEIHTDESPCEVTEPETPGTPEPTGTAAPEPTATTTPAPEATGTPAPTSSASPAPAASGAAVTLSSTSLVPGEPFRASVSGFAPGESVTFTLHSDPIRVGALRANADGTASGSLTLPASAPAGAHRLVAVGDASGTEVSVDVTVTGALAVTGGTIAGGAAAAVAGIGLVALGTTVVLRRRKSAATAE